MWTIVLYFPKLIKRQEAHEEVKYGAEEDYWKEKQHCKEVRTLTSQCASEFDIYN